MDTLPCCVSAKEGWVKEASDSTSSILPLAHGWSSPTWLWSAFPLDTANVTYHSHAVLDKSLSVGNVLHNSACYPKVSNAQWEELQSTLYSWVYKSRKMVLERQLLQ